MDKIIRIRQCQSLINPSLHPNHIRRNFLFLSLGGTLRQQHFKYEARCFLKPKQLHSSWSVSCSCKIRAMLCNPNIPFCEQPRRRGEERGGGVLAQHLLHTIVKTIWLYILCGFFSQTTIQGILNMCWEKLCFLQYNIL